MLSWMSTFILRVAEPAQGYQGGDSPAAVLEDVGAQLPGVGASGALYGAHSSVGAG